MLKSTSKFTIYQILTHAKVDEEDIGGNIDTGDKRKAKAAVYNLSNLAEEASLWALRLTPCSDFINAELPNETGLSASQYYMKLFNEVTGQNIEP